MGTARYPVAPPSLLTPLNKSWALGGLLWQCTGRRRDIVGPRVVRLLETIASFGVGRCRGLGGEINHVLYRDSYPWLL
jgi:hypothetical protein